jgi:soluble lytic murein transglycosylase
MIMADIPGRLQTNVRRKVDVMAKALSAALLVLTLTTNACAAEPQADAADPAALTKAFAAQDAKDWAGAKALVEKRTAVVRDLVQWRFVSTSGSGATFDDIDAFLSAHANWPGRSAIAQRGEEALLAENLIETKGAAWFKAHAPRSSGGCLAYAKFEFSHERQESGLNEIRRCWLTLVLNMPDYKEWVTLSGASLADTDHLSRADTALWNRNVSMARELLPMLPPKAVDVATARVQVQSGKPAELDDVIDNDTPPVWGASVLFDQAVQLRKAGKDKDAWPVLIRAGSTGALPQAYGPTWWAEHNWEARGALDAKDFQSAYRIASGSHISSTANVTPYLDSEFLSGWIALRNLDEASKAATHFQNLEAAAKSPVTRARAAYWKVLALRALDEEGKAQQQLAVAAAEPTTFYGRLALELMKGAPPAASAAPKPSAASGKEDIGDLVLASEVLLASGDGRRANSFANAAIDGCQTTACATTLSARFSRKGNMYGALRSAKKAQTLGVVRTDQLYPMIDLPPACAAAGVPTPLVLALVRQESEFDPLATSGANARGLIQLLPSTAQDVARRYKLPYAKAADLHVPETNLTIGCYHVKDLMDAFGGSYVLTAASYNAGKGRVLSWIASHGDPRDPKVDVIDWIESIPFDETRNYVMRVLENQLAYKVRQGVPLQAQEFTLDLHRGSTP